MVIPQGCLVFILVSPEGSGTALVPEEELGLTAFCSNGKSVANFTSTKTQQSI